MANLSLLHGNCDYSSLGYAYYSFVAGTLTGNDALAYEFGSVGLQLAEKYNITQPAQCRLYFTFGCGTTTYNRHLSVAANYLEKCFSILKK